MKQVFKSFFLMLTIVALVSACSNNSGGTNTPAASSAAEGGGASTNTALKPITLKVMLFGDKPTDLGSVLTEFENRTKDTLNTKLEFEFNTGDDHKQKMKLKMSTGEQVDLAFDAPWQNLSQHVSQGLYTELDKYFNNDDYPGLKAAFSEEFLASNKIDGHIYAIPLTQYYTDIEAVMVRKDLREKYGMDPIASYDDYKVYLDNVRKNEGSMIPLALKGARGFFKMFEVETNSQTFRGANWAVNGLGITGTGADFNVALSEDGKTVVGVTTIGDPASEYASFPEPFNNPDNIYQAYDKYVAFNPYVQKDSLSEKDAIALFKAGKAASFEGTINDIPSVRQELQKAVPGADVEPFVYLSCAADKKAGCIPTDYKAWNDLVIPITAQDPDRTMKFIDWIFSSQENHDLFELGIEGTHWKAEGEKQYSLTEGSTNYIFPKYELTWNPILSRVGSDNDALTLDYLNYQGSNDSYFRIPLSGFTFNSDSVKTEIAKVQPKFDQAVQIFRHGLDPNWKQSAEKLNKELRALGLDTIREELKKQMQAYLDNGGI
ncbi:ABC transporter substrate-binding protein [Paenibacillus sp. Leaf72]|uniref:ABC transporter substrate-binding protein n=1 Tax=Paenibacillus sp. Leaf72 TaxID=1736234 RepID=UPI0006F2212D|nr:ABC transporter substrate-binding protein [Paenibacillus sp. Leaf72]KQN96089.1 ABC transporter substrate-binding protein [Paenibacillus sp. Leaf72]